MKGPIWMMTILRKTSTERQGPILDEERLTMMTNLIRMMTILRMMMTMMKKRFG